MTQLEQMLNPTCSDVLAVWTASRVEFGSPRFEVLARYLHHQWSVALAYLFPKALVVSCIRITVWVLLWHTLLPTILLWDILCITAGVSPFSTIGRLSCLTASPSEWCAGILLAQYRYSPWTCITCQVLLWHNLLPYLSIICIIVRVLPWQTM